MNLISSGWEITNLPLILDMQIRTSEKSHFLLETCTYMHIYGSLFSSRWGRRGWARGKSFEQFQTISSPFSTALPSLAVDRVTQQARNVVIAEIMVVPTVRRCEQNGSDYVTLKFNSAIVPCTRGTESEETLILFRKTTTPPTNARRKESSGNSRANSRGVMQSVSCALALCKSPYHFETY